MNYGHALLCRSRAATLAGWRLSEEEIRSYYIPSLPPHFSLGLALATKMRPTVIKMGADGHAQSSLSLPLNTRIL